jgi:hypothetical protein
MLHWEVNECVSALTAVSFVCFGKWQLWQSALHLQYLVNEITTCYHKHRKKKEGTGVL